MRRALPFTVLYSRDLATLLAVAQQLRVGAHVVSSRSPLCVISPRRRVHGVFLRMIYMHGMLVIYDF